VTRIAYKWVVPPIEGVYQSIEPVGDLAWLSDGSDYVAYGWSFDGEMFGESTYYYELAVTPVASLARENATPDNTEFYDIEEEDVLHISIFNGDIDNADDYQGFWGTTPESSNIALNDFVAAPMDDALLEALESTAVPTAASRAGSIGAQTKSLRAMLLLSGVVPQKPW
jgi:hypothetical protein